MQVQGHCISPPIGRIKLDRCMQCKLSFGNRLCLLLPPRSSLTLQPIAHGILFFMAQSNHVLPKDPTRESFTINKVFQILEFWNLVRDDIS
jgi:hypothetical protein